MFLTEKLNVEYFAETDISKEEIITRLREVVARNKQKPSNWLINRNPNYKEISIVQNTIKIYDVTAGGLSKSIIGNLLITLSDNNSGTSIHTKLNYDSFQMMPIIGPIVIIFALLLGHNYFSISSILFYPLLAFFLIILIGFFPFLIFHYRRIVKDYLQRLFYDINIPTTAYTLIN